MNNRCVKAAISRRWTTGFAALLGSLALLFGVAARPASASGYSSAWVDRTCWAAPGSGSPCVAVYGDVSTSAIAYADGAGLYVGWEWYADPTYVRSFRWAVFNFDVFDCYTGKPVWGKSYSYPTGTTLHDVDSYTTIGRVAGHTYAVQVRGTGDYVRRNANGTITEGHFSYGPAGGYIARGSCA